MTKTLRSIQIAEYRVQEVAALCSAIDRNMSPDEVVKHELLRRLRSLGPTLGVGADKSLRVTFDRPTQVEAIEAIAEYATGHPPRPKAELILRLLTGSIPESHHVAYALGRVLHHSGRCAAAVPLIERGCAPRGQDRRLWPRCFLGCAQLVSGRLQNAHSTLLLAAKDAEEFPVPLSGIYVALGTCELLMGNVETACSILTTTERLHASPVSPWALVCRLNLAQAYAASGDAINALHRIGQVLVHSRAKAKRWRRLAMRENDILESGVEPFVTGVLADPVTGNPVAFSLSKRVTAPQAIIGLSRR